MIRFFCVLWCSFCLMGYTQAQTSKKELDKMGSQIALQMCDCFNSSRDSSQFYLDKELLKILSTIDKKGDAKAEEYIASLPADKQQQLFAAMMSIENLNNKPFDNCLESKVNNNVAVYISKGGSQNEMLAMITKKLKKKKKCKLFRAFLLLSQK